MQHILQHFFKKNSLEEVPVESLQQLIKAYPYFAPGHFWLAKKLYNANDPAYKEPLRSATLYFHNPLWLHFQFPTEPRTEALNGLTAPQPASSVNGSGDIGYSHDLIEDVVLHQEPAYNNPDTLSPGTSAGIADLATVPFAGTSAEPPVAAGQPPHAGDSNGKEEPILLQAYHTVDYFASQGIRLSQEITPDDKLGKQLKSFTEWLKTMRRLPQTPMEEILEVAPTDAAVEQYAAHSLEENEVVTEAMAEVLMKQGKKDQAREMYHKLSLLNPHKSAYFAAKIEVLK